MGTIKVGNVWAEYQGYDYAKVRELLTYRPQGYRFSKAYKKGFWDGSICLMRRDGKFPAGLVLHVEKQLKAAGRQVTVEDQRQEPLPYGDLSYAHEQQLALMPHQIEAVQNAVEKGRGIIYHPVGAGKSIVLLDTVRRLSVPTLALVHRKDLLYQLADTAPQVTGLPPGHVGMIGDGIWQPKALTIATFQSLYSRLKAKETRAEATELLAKYRAVCVDEVHHVEAKTFEAVMSALPNAFYRFGFSATPFKSGERGTLLRVMGWTGEVIHHMPSEGGVKSGRLVPADVFMVEVGGKGPIDSDWPTAYRTGIEQHESRNDLIVGFAKLLSRQGPTLVLVERLAHGAHLAERLHCPFLRGDVSGWERNEAWEELRQGRLRCVVATVIADEGLDIPNIKGLVLGGGGKAIHRQIQRIGRGMRTAEGKDRLTAIDFMDRGRYLGRHARARRKAYANEMAYTLADVTYEETKRLLREEELEEKP